MSIIEFDRASIRLGGETILSEITISIDDGEFIGVLGPNGSGKTTLMRALLGLIKPSGGAVRLFGHPPRRGAADIGYVPQVRATTSHLGMLGFDVVASCLHGERWGFPTLRPADRHMVEDALAAVGARELADRPISDMSGGERQRLLLAQALMGSPRLLLLDEPLISLDPRQQEIVIDRVHKFGRDHGVTILFSAHELNQLLGAVDRVLYLGGGGAALGTVEEVATAPVLSRLYGSHIQVVHADGHIFVMSNGRDVGRSDHQHDDIHHGLHHHGENEHFGNVRV
jgi:zinc/manganese transport system ATP-binding protein